MSIDKDLLSSTYKVNGAAELGAVYRAAAINGGRSAEFLLPSFLKRT